MEGIEEDKAVAVVFEDGPARVAAGGDVVERSGVLDAQRPGHGLRLARRKIKCQDSRPDPKSFLLTPNLSLELDPKLSCLIAKIANYCIPIPNCINVLLACQNRLVRWI